MIALGTIGIRYGEAAVLGLLIIATGLLFLRRRPAGLVWFSALLMAVTAVQLYLEEGRWQLAPAYLLSFVIAFWLARPSGQPYRSARPYRAGGLVLRIIIVVLAVPALALPLLVPIFLIPSPAGAHPVGAARVLISGSPGETGPEYVSVWYPAGGDAPTLAPFWTRDELARHRLPGFPWIMSTHLTLVPTPARHRAPVTEGSHPLLLVLSGEGSLPGDYLPFILEAASRGWLVVQLRPGATEESIVQLLSELDGRSRDRALAGRVDLDRAALLLGGQADKPDLGMPMLHIGGDYAAEADLPSGAFALTFPGAQVPGPAYTVRHLMVRPARFLVGSSDVAPVRLERFLRNTVGAILADGSPSAPVFSGAAPDQQRLLGGTRGAALRRLPDERR